MSASTVTAKSSLGDTKVSAAAAAASAKAIQEAESLATMAKNKLAYLTGLVHRARMWAGESAIAAWEFIKGILSKYMVPASIIAIAATATRAGFTALANMAVTSAGWVARTATGLAKRAVRGLGWVGRKASQLVGKIHAGTGAWLESRNDAFFGGAERLLDGVEYFIEGTTAIAREVMTAPTTANIVNATSITLGAGMAANAITGGTVAAALATVPFAGAALAAAVAGGAVTLATIGTAALVGAGRTFFFPKKETVSSEEALQSEATSDDQAAGEQVVETARTTVKKAEKKANATVAAPAPVAEPAVA